MSDKRFERWNDHSCKVKDNQWNTLLNWEDVVDLLNEQQATINKLEQENRQLRQFINKGRRLSVKELIDNTNENELLKKKIRGLEKENEQLKEQVQILNKCCRLKLSDEAIKQAYADLNRREREKHSQGNAAYTAKINQNEVIEDE